MKKGLLKSPLLMCLRITGKEQGERNDSGFLFLKVWQNEALKHKKGNKYALKF
jgi:hypothetical protein